MNPTPTEKQAEAQALDYVVNLFQRPDQLEKLDLMRKKADGKKAAVEAMLRTGVQSQLEGIRSAINHLQTAKGDLDEIEKGMDSIRNRLKHIPALKNQMSKLSEENTIHGQYAAAVNNLQHIYNIDDTVQKAFKQIAEGRLLDAHQNIMDLERARDELMEEVHKSKSKNPQYELNLLKTYFEEVDKLVKELGKNLWMICSRALEAARDDAGAKQLVSALRIIDREHRIDLYYENQRQLSPTSFKPPGRPREWKKQLFKTMMNVARQRIDGCQFEDRSTNKQWLARYLEVCRKILITDLQVVKGQLSNMFPPEYRIFDRMLKYYHDCITDKIKEIVSVQLEKNEIVQLLDWIKNYGGETVLGTPALRIEAADFLHDNPLLPSAVMDDLLSRFVELTQKDLNSWMDKSLMHEKDDWYKHTQPEEDGLHFYYTQLPSILFGMVEDQVALTKVISHSIVPRFIDIAVEEFLGISAKLKDAATAYKQKHFQNRAFFRYYTATMIALANNMDICADSTEKLEKHLRLTMEITSSDNPTSPNYSTGELTNRSLNSSFYVDRQELIEKIQLLKKKWGNVMRMAIDALLEEISVDIKKHLEKLLTSDWLKGSNDLETICVTISDYHTDYEHLRPQLRCKLLTDILYKVVGEFIIAMDSRRLTYNSYEERHLAAEWLKKDAAKIEKLFNKFDDKEYPFPLITPVLPALGDILDMRDKSLLPLEVTGFARKFPDVHAELLMALMLSREDVGRNDAKTIAEDAVKHVHFHPKNDHEMIRLFQLCKTGGGRKPMPAIDDLRNKFTTLMANREKV